MPTIIQRNSISSGKYFPGLPKILQNEKDRAFNNGGTVENGVYENLIDPIYDTLTNANQWQNVVFFGVAGVRNVVSGSVSKLYDQSGNQYDATQSTSSKRPTDATAAAIGNKVYADFDGSDDNLNFDSAAPEFDGSDPPISWVGVYLHPATGIRETVFCFGDSDNDRIEHQFVTNTDRIRAIEIAGASDVHNQTQKIAGIDGSWNSRSLINSGGNADFWNGGSKEASNLDTTVGSADFTDATFGARRLGGSPSAFSDFKLATYIFLNTGISTIVRNNIAGTMRNYYSL